jgi:hypothetical protein
MAYPETDGTNLSDLARDEMIEHYAGEVDGQFAKASIMRQFVQVKPVRGTDTLINRRVGRTQLQALVDGVPPSPTKTKFGRVSVTVDTTIIARDIRSQLNEFQTDFNARAELGMDHGKELGKFFDEALLIQAAKGAAQSAPADLNSAIGAGQVETLATAGDELDPDLLYASVATIITEMQEAEVDTDSSAVFVRPTQYDVLLNCDKLIDKDFSRDNGDFANGTVKTIKGVPIVMTTRIPVAAIASHKLGSDYNWTSTEAKTVAIITHPQSLLVGETIPLTSRVFFDNISLNWFIDSYMAFGASPRRPDVSGVVRSA